MDVFTIFHRCTTQEWVTFLVTWSMTLRMEEMKKEIKTLKVEVGHNLDAEIGAKLGRKGMLFTHHATL